MKEIKTVILKISKVRYKCSCGCEVFLLMTGKNVICPKCALYLIENGKNKVNKKSYTVEDYKEGEENKKNANTKLCT